MKIRFLIVCALLASIFGMGRAAQAYIPHSHTIISRMARNDGKGAYAIEQDVEFKQGTENFKIRERWIVQDAQTMRLSAVGPNAKFEAVYKGKTRVAPDLKGGWKNGTPSNEFPEPYLFARSSNEFYRLLIKDGIVPSSFAKESVTFNPDSKTPNAPEPLVRLGRTDGTVAYVFGTPVIGDENKPGVWIEQDSFLLRKLRFPSSAEVVVNHNTTYEAGLKLAKDQHISWSGNVVNIHVVSVKAIGPAEALKLVASTTLTPGDAKDARLPDAAKEFYSRFR
jgi:hypothetical protein